MYIKNPQCGFSHIKRKLTMKALIFLTLLGAACKGPTKLNFYLLLWLNNFKLLLGPCLRTLCTLQWLRNLDFPYAILYLTWCFSCCSWRREGCRRVRVSRTLRSLPGVSERWIPLLRWISHLQPVGAVCCSLPHVVSTGRHNVKGCFLPKLPLQPAKLC